NGRLPWPGPRPLGGFRPAAINKPARSRLMRFKSKDCAPINATIDRMRGCNDVPTGAKWRGASSSDQRKEEEPPPRFLGFPRPLQWNLDSLQPLAHPRTPGKNPWCLSLPKSLGQIAQLALS